MQLNHYRLGSHDCHLYVLLLHLCRISVGCDLIARIRVLICLVVFEYVTIEIKLDEEMLCEGNFNKNSMILIINSYLIPSLTIVFKTNLLYRISVSNNHMSLSMTDILVIIFVYIKKTSKKLKRNETMSLISVLAHSLPTHLSILSQVPIPLWTSLKNYETVVSVDHQA